MKNTLKHLTHFALASALALATPGAALAEVTFDDIVNDHKTGGDIVTNGLGTHLQRHSPLNDINKDNVKHLLPVWSFAFGGEGDGEETQPIYHDGTLYVTGSWSRIWAIDARTGDEKWEYKHRLPNDIVPCCGKVNRGTAIHGDMIYWGTLDAYIIAFNRHTGEIVWEDNIASNKDGYAYTAAPLIARTSKGRVLVVTGLSGGEFGVIGRVEARDAKTGEVVWKRPTLECHKGELNGKPSGTSGTCGETWPGEMWKTGGGAPWLGGSYDPELNLVYFGTSNPSPWNSHLRKGGSKNDDNLYTASRLAIDVDTGEIKWHFQSTPHDGWDFDGVNELVLFDMDGVKAGATADRNGFFYVLNRENGKFINGFPFVKDVTWAKGLDKNGRPIYIEDNRPGDPGSGKKGKVVEVAPSFLGGKNWQPMSYSPRTKLFYVPSNEWKMDLWNEPIQYKKGAAFLGAGFTIKPIYDDHIGSLKAIDPKTGKWVWEYKNSAPLWGGVLTTAGGLVFVGTPEGYLKAFDDKTGKELWKFRAGSGIISSPVTWTMDGEQYIGVASGWGGGVPIWGGDVASLIKDINGGGSYWAFKIPKALSQQ